MLKGAPGLSPGSCARLGRSRKSRAIVLASNQQSDHDQIENVGANAGGESGRVVSEVIVEKARDPATGGHADIAE